VQEQEKEALRKRGTSAATVSRDPDQANTQASPRRLIARWSCSTALFKSFHPRRELGSDLFGRTELLAENYRRSSAVSMKVSEKGAVSVYGLGLSSPFSVGISLARRKVP